ncbi:hypothetical protein LJR267_002889 [Paraburkholderia hospita]|uniref:hypothetical protein n=1 Tax=Paraburkholderia hospita TaxID=169430 RepID=UPI003ECC97C5
MKNSEQHCVLSIVIPVYRSAGILPLLVEKINEEMTKASLVGHVELLLVNDSSPDNCW